MNAANRRTRVLVRGRGHSTGVEHNNFGFAGRFGPCQSAVEQLALNRGTVCLRRAASEILDKVTGHSLIISVVRCRLRASLGFCDRA